jgi:hypothetical protein
MGLIKEPINIDFFVDSEPLTEKEKLAISKFIQEYKTKKAKKQSLVSKSIKIVKKRHRDPVS